MKTKKLMMTLAVFTMMAFSASISFAAGTGLTVACTEEISLDGTAVCSITADSGDIAGAAFTVNFDDTVFSVTEVTSAAFETFIAQGISEIHDTYDKGLVTNDISGKGTAIAAANATEVGTVDTDVVLFEVKLSPKEGATEGDYTVGIIPTTLSNDSAGYDPAGEEIDLLVGISGSEYPVRLAVANVAVTPATITLTDTPPIPDGLQAYMDANQPDLQDYTAENPYVVTAESDFDKDGYTDAIEYTNRALADPDGKNYDPLFGNAPDGDGYVAEKRTYLQGDTDLSGIVNIDDVKLAFRIAIGLATPSSEQFANANVYDDGDKQNQLVINDVKGLFRLAIGLGLE